MDEEVSTSSVEGAIRQLGMAVERVLDVKARLAKAGKSRSAGSSAESSAETGEALEREFKDALRHLRKAFQDVVKLLQAIDETIANLGSDSSLLGGTHLLNRVAGGRLMEARRLLDGERSSMTRTRKRLLDSLDSSESSGSGGGLGSGGSTGANPEFLEALERDRASLAAEGSSRASAPEYFGETIVISDSGGGESMSFEPTALSAWLADSFETEGGGAGSAEQGGGSTGGDASGADGLGQTGDDGDSYGGADNGGGRTP